MQLQGNRVINTHQMLDEVKSLEGVGRKTRTKSVDAFKKLPLKGLMKKHFTDASFIVKNLGAHFSYDNGGNKRLNKLIREAFSRNTSGVIDDDFISYLAHNTTIGAIEERSMNNNITGEWIVFQKHEGKNYYLTLGAHDEGDDKIYDRVCMAYNMDFQFLRNKA